MPQGRLSLLYPEQPTVPRPSFFLSLKNSSLYSIKQKRTEDFQHESKKTDCIHDRINSAGLFGVDSLDGDKFNFGEGRQLSMIISNMQARSMLRKGCIGYLAHIVHDNEMPKLGIQDVPVVNEFLDVFPEELPGLAPE